MRAVILAMVCVAALATPSRAGLGPSTAGSGPAIALRVPLLPFTWVGSRVRALFRHRHQLENASVLRRDQGWTVLDVPVNEPASVLYVEVAGRVQFESAEILFRDGAVRKVDLRGAVRGRGLFELHDCALAHDVTTVRLNVRAATDRAQVGVRIARFGAPTGNG